MAKVANRRGRYVLDYYDNQGIRQRKTLKKGATLKKAKEKLREIEDQIAKGIYLPDNKIPVFSEVAEEWINHKTSNLRDSTWSVYEGHTRNHFHEFDDLKINQITVAMIEKMDHRQTGSKNADRNHQESSGIYEPDIQVCIEAQIHPIQSLSGCRKAEGRSVPRTSNQMPMKCGF